MTTRVEVEPQHWSRAELLHVGYGHPVSVEERTKALNEVLPGYLTRTKGRAVSRSSEGIRVSVPKQSPNHVVHAILSLMTAGLWLIVWLFVSIINGGTEDVLITVDETGMVIATPMSS